MYEHFIYIIWPADKLNSPMSSLSSKVSQVYYGGLPHRSYSSSSGDSNHGFASPPSKRGGSFRPTGSAVAVPPFDRTPPTLAQLNPDERQHIYEEVLNSERDFLCRSLEPSRHMPYLRSKGCFDLNTQQRINHHVTSMEKADAFIDEILRGGLTASVAFFDSLQKERVTQSVLTRLLDTCQASLFKMYQEQTNRPASNEDDTRLPYDLNDETESGNVGELRSSGSAGLIDEPSELLGLGDHVEDDSPKALPRPNIEFLRKAQGIPEPEATREGEEASDVSSTYELTSHGTEFHDS